jgi:hypothetical protein
VLWLAPDSVGAAMSVTAFPEGTGAPVTFHFQAAGSPADNYPSGLSLPHAGCWRLEVAIGDRKGSISILVGDG